MSSSRKSLPFYRYLFYKPLLQTALTVGLLALSLFALLGRAQTMQAAINADLVVYGDALASNWQDWSWSSTVNFANSTPIHQGTASIAVSYSAGWAGASLRAPSVINTTSYTGISFWAHGGSSGSRSLNFYIQQNDGGGNSNIVPITVPAGSWTQFTVSMSYRHEQDDLQQHAHQFSGSHGCHTASLLYR